MRYIVVNYRVPRGINRYCAMCVTPITDGYVRDLTTSVIYHSFWCLERHIEQSLLCIEDAARRVS